VVVIASAKQYKRTCEGHRRSTAYLPCNDFGWWPGDQALQEIINGFSLQVRIGACGGSVVRSTTVLYSRAGRCLKQAPGRPVVCPRQLVSDVPEGDLVSTRTRMVVNSISSALAVSKLSIDYRKKLGAHGRHLVRDSHLSPAR